MSQRLYHSKNWLEGIPDRISYAWKDPEERFEWLHLTRRRAYRNLCNLPGELYSWSITSKERGGKPLFPDLSKSYKSGGDIIDSSLFTGILFKQVLDIGVKFGLSAFVKTSVAGYNRDSQHSRVLAASDELLALGRTAVIQNPEAQAFAEAFAKEDQGALLSLSRNMQDANKVMTQFAQGTMAPTEENIKLLHSYLETAAELCEKKAGIPTALKGGPLPAGAKPHDLSTHAGEVLLAKHVPEAITPAIYASHKRTRPSEHIRKVVAPGNITNAHDAAVYLATLSSLITDGAFTLESDIYRPKDDTFLTAKESLQIAQATEAVLNQQRMQLQRLPVPEREGATHIMMQRDASGATKTLSNEQIISAANSLKGRLAFLAPKVERMLAYADLHYAEIDGLVVNGKLNIERSADNIKHSKDWAKQLAAAPAPTQDNLAHSDLPDPYYNPQAVGLAYITRPEARHEMSKLYFRSLPTYLYQAPINLVERLILPNAKGKWEFNKKVVASELKAATWMAAYNPAAESLGGVSAYEASRLAQYSTIQRSKRMDGFLAAALETTRTADPEFYKKMGELKGRQSFEKLSEKYRDVLTKPEKDRTQEDYARLAEYFHHLSSQSETMSKECYSLISNGKEDFSGFREHIQGVVEHGTKSTSDVVAVLTLMRFIREIADDQVLSLEFIQSDDIVVERENLDRIARQTLKIAHDMGIAIAGENFRENGKSVTIKAEGVPDGTLVLRQPDGKFAAAGKATLMEYADKIAAFLRSEKGIQPDKLFDLTHGRLSERYLHNVEAALLEETALPTPAKPKAPESATHKNATPLSKLQSHHEQKVGLRELLSHACRPEAMHEMTTLRDRYLAVALFGFPVKIATNILRGDFKKIHTAFGKWSLASTAFSSVANTLAPSYGAVALRETMDARKLKLVKECDASIDNLSAAIGAMGEALPDMKSRFAAATGINPLLGDEQQMATLTSMHEVSNQRAMNGVVESFVNNTLHSLSGKHDHHFTVHDDRPQSLLAGILSMPAQDASGAVLKLAAVESLLHQERRFVDRLDFEGVSERMLDNKQLKELTNYIQDRFYSEHLTLGKAAGRNVLQGDSAKDSALLIALADDIGQKAKGMAINTSREKTRRKDNSFVAQLEKDIIHTASRFL